MKNNCIISAVGKDSLHKEWMQGEGYTDFDLHLIVYDDSMRQYSKDTSFIEKGQGYKLRLVYDYLQKHVEYMERYEYFFIPDDDISASADDVSLLFRLMRKYKLQIAQPSLIDSFFTFRHTLHDERFKLRYTSFVEMMMPCFSRDALRCVLPTFNENERGWGCEYHWARLIGASEVDMAVIDEVRMRHVRPVSSFNVANLTDLRGYLHKYQLPFEIRMYSSIPKSEIKTLPYFGNKQAVLLMSHFFNRQQIWQQYNRLRTELCPERYDIYLLLNTYDYRST